MNILVEYHLCICPYKQLQSRKNICDMSLKSCRSILESKGHSNELEFPPRGTKGCLLNVSFIHFNLIIAFVKVHFRQISSFSNLVKEIFYKREFIWIWLSAGIQFPVVYTQADIMSGFRTETTGDDHGLSECLKIPFSTRSLISSRSWSLQ